MVREVLHQYHATELSDIIQDMVGRARMGAVPIEADGRGFSLDSLPSSLSHELPLLAQQLNCRAPVQAPDDGSAVPVDRSLYSRPRSMGGQTSFVSPFVPKRVLGMRPAARDGFASADGPRTARSLHSGDSLSKPGASDALQLAERIMGAATMVESRYFDDDALSGAATPAAAPIIDIEMHPSSAALTSALSVTSPTADIRMSAELNPLLLNAINRRRTDGLSPPASDRGDSPVPNNSSGGRSDDEFHTESRGLLAVRSSPASAPLSQRSLDSALELTRGHRSQSRAGDPYDPFVGGSSGHSTARSPVPRPRKLSVSHEYSIGL